MTWDFFTFLWIVLLVLLLIIFILALTYKTIVTDPANATDDDGVNASNYTTVATKLNINIPYHILTPDVMNAHYFLPNGNSQGQTLVFLLGDPNDLNATVYVWPNSFRINGNGAILGAQPVYPFADSAIGSITKAIWYNNAWAFSTDEI